MTRTRQADLPEARLALILRDALIEAWIARNGNHDSPDFDAVKHLGHIGYVHVARALIRRGVKPPLPDCLDSE